MIPILIAAIAVVGTLCLLDLLLTFGVIRRLREHTELLTAIRSRPGQEFGLPIGERPGPFSAVTTDGERLSAGAGLRAVAFFSPCDACQERAPLFASYLREGHLAPDSALVVSVGPGSALLPYLAELAGLARICVEREGGEIAKAFNVNGFPFFFQLDEDGVVIGSGWDPPALPKLATAMA